MSPTQITVGPILTRGIEVVTEDSISGEITYHNLTGAKDGMLKIQFTGNPNVLNRLEEEVRKTNPSMRNRIKQSYIAAGCKPLAIPRDTVVQTRSGEMLYKDAVAAYNSFKANVTYTFNDVTTYVDESYSKTVRFIMYTSITPELTDIEAY